MALRPGGGQTSYGESSTRRPRGGAVWASFNWAKEIGLEEAIRQQEELTEPVEERQLVIKTAVLEQVLDEWPTKLQRQVQTVHSGAVWISENGLAFSRAMPLLPD